MGWPGPVDQEEQGLKGTMARGQGQLTPLDTNKRRGKETTAEL